MFRTKMKVLKHIFCFGVLLEVLIQISTALITQPDELQNMLETGNYEEFSKITRVPLDIAQKTKLTDTAFVELISAHHGDIMLLPEQLQDIGKKALYPNGLFFKKWDRFVPYTIIPTNYTEDDIYRLEESIRSFNTRFTGIIEFRRQRPDDENYVVIFNGNACFSHTGMLGGIQALVMDTSVPHLEPCLVTGYAHHEMMHTIGMMHTNTRIDRDLYILNYPDRLDEGLHNLYFPIIPNTTTTDPSKLYFEMEGPYEYTSIMHLPPKLFPNMPEPIFDILRSDVDPAKIGDLMHNDITDLDVKMVRNYYGMNY